MLPRAEGGQPRAALGITTGGSSRRDTLGILISSVIPNSPADKAGIEEGDRIVSINGVNLRVDPADAGDADISGAMTRRLTRELERVRPGDEVDLRVYSGGDTRTVRVRTTESDSLYGTPRAALRNNLDQRAALGVGLASTHTRRDTLGVLVMFVDDSGPAASAGIEEGNRIAAINGIDLRVARDDAGDDAAAMAKVRQLQHEISRLHPGDDVDLRVYANGRFRTMQLRAARASDLSRRDGAFMITGGMAPMPPMMPMGFNGAIMGDQMRQTIERAMEGANRAMQGLGRGLERTRIYMQDDAPDAAPRVEPIEPVHIEPIEPSQLRLRAPRAVPRLRAAVLSDSDSDMPNAVAVLTDDDASASRTTGKALDIGGLRMVPVGRELATYLGAGSERGLLVIEVPEWAHRVLHAGDVVLRVDGRDVRPNSDEVTVALPRFRDAQLDILREGVHHSVTLPARR